MYFKIIYRLLKAFVWLILCVMKMASKKKTDGPVSYGFKAFKFEKVVSRPNCRVPFPRSGHRIGADSSNFYCFGGYNPVIPPAEPDVDNDQIANSYPLFQELWRFNFATKTWYRYPNSKSLPTELASNALWLHRNFLMVYGGTGSPFGFRCSNQLYLCRVNNSQGVMEEVQTSGQMPSPLYGQALIYHNEYLYTIGGTSGLSYTCDIHRLNLKTKVWEVVYIGNGQHEYEPKGRYRHEVAFDGHNIYVLGGGRVEIAYGFYYLPVFNLEKAVWFNKKTVEDSTHGVPPRRLCHGAVQIKTDNGIEVYIAGGHDGENLFDDLWRLNLNTLQWTYITYAKLPRRMYFHAAAVTPEGRMCIFGGIYRNRDEDSIYIDRNEDSRRSNTIYTTWICIPKLSEMCWEALLYYFPKITDCDKQNLIDVGLPRHYVRRLGSLQSCCK